MTPITQPDDTAGYAPAARPLRILFASDGSEAADGARRFLAALPLPTGSAVHILTVVRGMEWELSDWLRAVESELGRRIVEGAATSLQQEGVAVTTAVEIGAPAQEILTAAEELDADLIVLGSRGLGDVEGFLLGSVARNVVKHAGRPVLLARAPTNGLRRVLVAVDSSEHAARAAEFAERLPLPPGAELALVHVVRPYHPFPGLVPDDPAGLQREVETVRRRHREAGEQLLASARARLVASGRPVTTAVREGDPASEIQAAAVEMGADLIVAGARGASLIRGLVVGSVADRLLRSREASVLLVH